jgi:hypothetical protein
MSAAYVYIVVIGIFLYSAGFYNDSNFFNWGPPIKLFGKEIVSQKGFYMIHLMIFFHQLVNNWVNTVVYPWIINNIQDPKCRQLQYSTATSLLLINFFNLYSELDVMLILMGFTSQISFIVTVTLANIITSTYINYKYILNKRQDHDLLLEVV